MDKQLIFNFKTDVSQADIPVKLNNPFVSTIPEIASIAANEFQQFLVGEIQNWDYDFSLKKGKMFGILVVQKTDNTFGYLGAISGRLPIKATPSKFIPSIFNAGADDHFIDKGMTEITKIGNEIQQANSQTEITALNEKRKQKSLAVQQQLFENYRFLNLLGKEKNVLQIFCESSHGKPPSAAGECAAPKLLNYAFMHNLKPIAIAEFWWGCSQINIEKKHKNFYPACKNKCRPILEYMLNDSELYNQASLAG